MCSKSYCDMEISSTDDSRLVLLTAHHTPDETIRGKTKLEDRSRSVYCAFLRGCIDD